MGLWLLPAAFTQNADTVNGEWLITRDAYGYPLYHKMTLHLANGRLTGTFWGDKLEGTLNGNALHFVARDAQGNTAEVTGTFAGDIITGKAVEIDASNPTDKAENAMTATRPPQRSTGPPQRHQFTPTVFYRQFSASNKPVLQIAPGDTVHTTTVDAGGTDEHGIKRVLGGNPETGPFFVETAWPGDMLVLHFRRIRLNRDYAVSDDAVVGRALDNDMSVKMKDTGKSVVWHLDTTRMVATSGSPGDHLKQFEVPLRPMLGCVATAPGFGSAPPSLRRFGSLGRQHGLQPNRRRCDCLFAGEPARSAALHWRRSRSTRRWRAEWQRVGNLHGGGVHSGRRSR